MGKIIYYFYVGYDKSSAHYLQRPFDHLVVYKEHAWVITFNVDVSTYLMLNFIKQIAVSEQKVLCMVSNLTETTQAVYVDMNIMAGTFCIPIKHKVDHVYVKGEYQSTIQKLIKHY